MKFDVDKRNRMMYNIIKGQVCGNTKAKELELAILYSDGD